MIGKHCRIGALCCVAVLVSAVAGSNGAVQPDGDNADTNVVAKAQAETLAGREVARLRKRNETSDALRTEFRRHFPDVAALKVIPSDSNIPWTKADLDGVTNLLHDIQSPKFARRIWYPQITTIASILAFTASSFPENPALSSKARELYGQVLDSFIEASKTNHDVGRHIYCIDDALEKYGDADLVLLPAVWKAMEGNYISVKALEMHGDERALPKLKALIRKCEGDRPRLIQLYQTLLVLTVALEHPDNPIFRGHDRRDHAGLQWSADHGKCWCPELVMENPPKL